MELSSPRFKSLAVTAGLSFWFYAITAALNLFSIQRFVIFVACVVIITQIFAVKVSRGLDIIAIINTRIFLGLLFVLVVSMYGILFRILRIDLLRLKRRRDTYWLEMEETKSNRIRKQY